MKYTLTALLAAAVMLGYPCSDANANSGKGKGKENKPEKNKVINKGKQKKATRFARNAVRWQRRLSNALENASGATVHEIAEKYAEEVQSDEDTFPDFLELALGLSSCKSDSDDDGIQDDDEYEDDELVGGGDDDEVEIEGLISALSESSITVGEKNFLLNEDTEYKDDEKNELELSDFEAGDCVEVEGYEQEDLSLLAKEVKLRDDEKCSEDSEEEEGEEEVE